MARKKHSPEQIVAILRQIEVEVANHKPTGQACREAGIVPISLPTSLRRRGVVLDCSHLCSRQLSLRLLKIEPHLSKFCGTLRVHSGTQIGFL